MFHPTLAVVLSFLGRVPARLLVAPTSTAGGHCRLLRSRRRWFGDDRGQATAEYALVLLGAAAIAVVLITWATSSGRVTELLDGVIDNLLGHL